MTTTAPSGPSGPTGPTGPAGTEGASDASGPASLPPPASGDSTTLALSELGASNTIWFDARQDITSSTFSFVIPKGLAPTSLNATLEVPVRLRFGNMTVT